MNQRIPPFPKPTRVGRRRFWTKRDVRCWQAAMAGLPEPPPQPDDDHWIDARALRQMLGGVSHMFIVRALKAAELEAA